MLFHLRAGAAAALILAPFVAASAARAESLSDALASAYSSNATLNAARAQLRSIDESVPQALAGYRPTISAEADASAETFRSLSNGFLGPSLSNGNVFPRGVGLTITQPVFLGFRTTNSVKEAKNSVAAARAQLVGMEQDTLLQAVTAFMNVVEAQVVLNLRVQNIDFLKAQVSAANDRMRVGEGTKTDVAEANARLSAGMSDYNAATAAVNSAIAVYEQVIGHKPNSLGAVPSVDPMIPPSLQAAIDAAQREHPSIIAGIFTIDVASYNVKVLEGQFLPSVTLQGSLSHRDDSSSSGTWSDSASILGQLSVPIYNGGLDSSQVRQAKEVLGQRRVELDAARAAVRQAVISAWGTLDATKAQVTAAQAEVAAEQLVLSGVMEQRKVGQSTTLDVLNAQQELLGAQVAQVQAQHDRVVAAYTLLSALGRLTAEDLHLRVAIYDPSDHYNQVKDKWFGLRTPDGR